MGDLLTFGQYEQDNNLANGPEPIQWQVLDVNDKDALLISQYVLDCQPYHTTKEDITWANCSLRAWLLNSFYASAFTHAEQEVILPVTNHNGPAEGHSDWATNGGKVTVDKVFLLSIREKKQYFADNKSAKTPGTEYARSHGAKLLGLTTIGTADSDWWLRSPGSSQHDASFVGTLVHDLSTKQVTDKVGIRPVIRINLSADWASFPHQQMQDALTLAENACYPEAIKLLESLGTYNNCKEILGHTLYAYATATMENGDYSTAIKLLEEYRSYSLENELALDKDFLTVLPDAYYQQGKLEMSRKQYQEAVETFSHISQHKDVMDQLRSCFVKLHIPYQYLTKSDAVVNAGSKYAENKPRTDKDPHFGWSLGRFMLSGYTEVQDSANYPTFIKTPGDSLILWFDLDQDINLLNGKKGMTIVEDTDGLDQPFGFPKTNMGRGALLIRHIDYHNGDNAPVPYLNFLEASDLGTANTHVEVKEEGIYEVALDYEIRSGMSTNNYRISCTFQVKNGSSMFYLFDVASGAELEDYARTADGFRIDLANSHSLKIDVVRYALNQARTGLDVRASAPASDGDSYTKVGYYLITIQNTETHEKLTKHLFVGSQNDLASYQAVDNSLMPFGNK